MKQRPRLLRTLRHYLFWIRKHQKAILLSLAGTIVIWLVFAITIGLLYQRRHANDPLTVGVSFSKEYSNLATTGSKILPSCSTTLRSGIFA